MPKIQPIEDVFSPGRIEELKENIRDTLSDRYDEYNGCVKVNNYSTEQYEIAFGNMVNGIALVYIGRKQSDIKHIERTSYAQLAIDIKGEIVPLKLFNDKGYTIIQGNEIDIQEIDSTLVSIKLRRCFYINNNDLITTDDFALWNDCENSDVVSMSEYITCEIELFTGDDGNLILSIDYPPHCINHDIYDRFQDKYGENEFYIDDSSEYEDEDDDDDDDEWSSYETLFSGSNITDDYKSYYSLIRCNGWRCNTIKQIKLDTSFSTRFIINHRYLLLYDNLKNHFKEPDPIEEYYWTNIPKIDLDKIHTEDLFGIFDIIAKKTIIHAGEVLDPIEMELISGFSKLEFRNHRISIYDNSTQNSNSSTLFSPVLFNDTKPYERAHCLSQVFYRAKYSFSNERDKIREGKHTGRTIGWLLEHGYAKDVIKMIDCGYLFIKDFNSFTYPDDEKIRNAVWIALDKQRTFKDVSSFTDPITIELSWRYYYNLHYYDIYDYSPAKYDDYYEHRALSFEEIIDTDTNYLVALINKRSLYVKQQVIEELKDCHSGNKRFLSKLRKIETAINEYNEEIEYFKQAEWDMIREEEDRKWQEEAYRQAFEDDPEAEWNID